MSLDLYEDESSYEVNCHRACIHEDAIEIDEMTVEKEPPDRNGLRHEVEDADFVALKKALAAEGPGLAEDAGVFPTLKEYVNSRTFAWPTG